MLGSWSVQGESKHVNNGLLCSLFVSTLTDEKLWKWYGKTWAINDPYLGMVWEGWVKIWNWYGAQFCHILMFGKFMGRKADAIHCMGQLWEYNFHIYSIAATHLLALRLLLKIVKGFRYQWVSSVLKKILNREIRGNLS